MQIVEDYAHHTLLSEKKKLAKKYKHRLDLKKLYLKKGKIYIHHQMSLIT